MSDVLIDPNLIGLIAMATAIALAMTLIAAQWLAAQLIDPNPQQRTAVGGGAPNWKKSLVHSLSLWVGILSGIVAFRAWGWKANVFWRDWLLLNEVLTGGIIVTCLGFINDAFSLRRRELATGQLLVCMILVTSGMVIRSIEYGNVNIEFGIFAVPMTLTWLLAAINLFAFVDKKMGLSAGTAIVVGIVLIGSTITHAPIEAFFLSNLIVAGLLGWVIFDYSRGQDRLGRTATMHCGVLLGIVTPHLFSAGREGPGLVRFSPALVIWALPLLVAALHAAYRRLFGSCLVPVPANDKPKQTDLPSISQVKQRNRPQEGIVPRNKQSGSRNWEPLWETLCACADQLELSTIEMHIDFPSRGEAFHKARVSRHYPLRSELWQMEFPLRAGEKLVGRVHLVGETTHESINLRLSQIMVGLRPFEIHFLALLESHPHLPDTLIAPPPLSLRLRSTMLEQVPVAGRDDIQTQLPPDSLHDASR